MGDGPRRCAAFSEGAWVTFAAVAVEKRQSAWRPQLRFHAEWMSACQQTCRRPCITSHPKRPAPASWRSAHCRWPWRACRRRAP
jgi:hypothetical protein